MKRVISLLAVVFPLFIMAQPPAGYYNSASGLSCAPLKTALRNIINNGVSPQCYTPCLWNQYQVSDIKPREVGSGSANVIWDIYSDNPLGTDPYNFTPGTDQCSSTTPSSEGVCYNREHSIPLSWFSGSTSTPGPATDYHHVFPTDNIVNGKRANYPYGTVASATWTSLNGSKLGSSAVAGITGPVFEPIDQYKGDVARAFFYFVTMYENNMPTWGSNPDAAQAFEPNTFPSIDIAYLKLMLQWHNLDPVSQKEIDRNNAGYSFQGNRNPFVDYPQYVNQVWNASCPGLSALPVDIVLFMGKLDGNTISLKWDVAAEANLAFYEIQRSVNGTDYSTIGSVKAEGRTSYLFNDHVESLRGRRLFYRIRKVDTDGRYSYSTVFTIHVPTNTTFSVYPNPASEVLRIQLNTSTVEALVGIADITGRVVYSGPVKASQGKMEIVVGRLRPGSYLVSVVINGEVYTQRVVISR